MGLMQKHGIYLLHKKCKDKKKIYVGIYERQFSIIFKSKNFKECNMKKCFLIIFLLSKTDTQEVDLAKMQVFIRWMLKENL